MWILIENVALMEHCIEKLRNVIAFFQMENIFSKLSHETQSDVWNETWNILSEVTPDLKQDLAQLANSNSNNIISNSNTNTNANVSNE